MEPNFKILAAIQIAWIVLGLWRFFRRGEEIPALCSSLIFYFSAYRYWTVQVGWRTWGDIGNLGFGQVSNEEALQALVTIVVGESILLLTYMLFQTRAFPPVRDVLSPVASRWLRPKVFAAALILIPISVLLRGHIQGLVEEGASMAFQTSAYIRLFPLVLSTVAILLILLWRYGGLAPEQRLIAMGLVVALAYFTYGVQGRFQFLSWFIAGVVIVTAGYSAGRRLVLLALGVAGILAVFSMAGAQRRAMYEDYSVRSATLNRFLIAEDANMLDGLVLLQQVVPSKFDYRYGMEHLEIFIRPIPRAWWPNKPVTSYMLKISGLDKEKGMTIGISPSLFGSFYLEANYVGVVVLSCIYGYVLASLMRFGAGLNPLGGLLMRGLLCACLVPLLRGGDLPGVYATIAMAFWPMLLLFLFRRQYLGLTSPWFVQATAPPPPVRPGRGAGRRPFVGRTEPGNSPLAR